MVFGLPLVGSLLGGGGQGGVPGFTDTGSAVSGATLGAVTIGGINPAPQGFEVTPTAVALGVAIALGIVVVARKR